MKKCETKSSKWVNENQFLEETTFRFEWQRVLEVLVIIKSSIPNVYKYIENQEIHHNQEDFKMNI